MVDSSVKMANKTCHTLMDLDTLVKSQNFVNEVYIWNLVSRIYILRNSMLLYLFDGGKVIQMHTFLQNIGLSSRIV